MSRRLAAGTAALAGLLLLAVLMPRHEASLLGDSAASWSRERAVRAAMDFSRHFGVDLTGWHFFVEAERSETLAAMAERFPESNVLRAMPPRQVHVVAVAPGGAAGVRIDFFENGAPARWNWHSSRRASSAPAPNPPDVNALLPLFVGENAANFEEQKQPEDSKGAVRRVWKWNSKVVSGVADVVEATWREGTLREVVVHPETSPSAMRTVRSAGRGLEVLLEPFGVLFTITAFVVGGWYGLTRLLRRRDHLRFVFWLLLPYALLVAVSLRFGLEHDAGAFSAWKEGGVPGEGLGLGEVVQRSLQIAGTLGAGFVLLRGWQITAWSGLLLAGRRRWFAVRTGAEVVNGWLAGPAIATIAYLVAAAWPGAGPVTACSPSWLVDSWPLLSLPAAFVDRHVAALCFFGVLVPWILRGTQWPKARVAILIFGGWSLAFGRHSVMEGSVWASGLVAALVAALAWLLYTRAGLLAVFTALLSADLVRAAVLRAASGSWTSPEAWQAALGWLAVLAFAAFVERRGNPASLDELTAEIARRNDPPPSADQRPERERLQSDFAVAAAVQRGVLPASSPSVAGYTLAAECSPAREVGGDLYDFLPLEDGRWALCVADVSGKGVPAALYMTLTKGMLAAERALARDIRRMALSINRNLHESGRRRTFVTMALAALHPEKHSAEILRAGHNPILWWRSASAEARFLMPGGMGLGLAPNSVFERTLATETLSLDPGDVLLLYSDGLTEAMDPDRAQFGEDRLVDALRRHASLDAPALLSALAGEVERFKRGAEPHDDLTILVLKRNPVS
jgi:serine phosphatase RsbU (regulator of sigma subunit)